tara:strand:+ start:815 stop:988 length:174 start_codon:yes stop_codon:yes gene_type:complete
MDSKVKKRKIMKKYYASISEDIYVRAKTKDEAIAEIKNRYQPLGANLDIEIYDEEEE